LNIVITGCSKGIGAELVKLWSKDHCVYGLSRDHNALKSLKSSLDNPSNFHFISHDITQLNRQVIENWIKTDEIDILINNAGSLLNKPFNDINYEEYRNLMDVNFWGTFNISQLLINKLSNTNGQIIIISSMGGVNYSSKFSGLSLYSSSKGAVTTLGECLAEELKPFNIRVNTLALGAVQTEMLKKAFPDYTANITPKEMADYIINFCSSVGNVLNGQIIKATSSNP
jgi:short-subunit dehydrogenase